MMMTALYMYIGINMILFSYNHELIKLLNKFNSTNMYEHDKHMVCTYLLCTLYLYIQNTKYSIRVCL